MLKVGITGGIGSGKTTVCKIFEILGIPVFYADNVAKSIMNTDMQLRDDLIRTFGDNAYLDTGELNRVYLAGIVFNNAAELAKLNSLVHPAVFRAFNFWAAKQQAPYLLKEAALLFESNSYKMCDRSVLVKSPKKLKIARLQERDGFSVEEIRWRMNKQLPDKEKEKLADHILINDEVMPVIPQILKLHAGFLKLSDDH